MVPFNFSITVLTPSYMLTETTSPGCVLVDIRFFSFINGDESVLRLARHRFAKDARLDTTLTRNMVLSLNLRAASPEVRLPLWPLFR